MESEPGQDTPIIDRSIDRSTEQLSTYHKVFASVKVGEVVGVAFENESLVVKIVFVSVDGVYESRTDGQTGDDGLPVVLEGFDGTADELGIGPRQKVAALDLGRAGESRQFRRGSRVRF